VLAADAPFCPAPPAKAETVKLPATSVVCVPALVALPVLPLVVPLDVQELPAVPGVTTIEVGFPTSDRKKLPMM
jgi:hypothetical protein